MNTLDILNGKYAEDQEETYTVNLTSNEIELLLSILDTATYKSIVDKLNNT